MERAELKVLGIGVLVGLAAGFLLARSLYLGSATPTAGPVLLGPAAPGAAPPPSTPAARPAAGGPGAAQAGQAPAHDQINALIEKVKADPKDRKSRVALGNVTFDNGLYDLAVRYYEEALALQADDPDVITDLGVSYRYLRQSQKAVEHFERAVALRPEHVQGWFNIAVVKLSDLGDPAGARVAMDRVLALKPDMPGAQEVDKKIREALGS